MLPRDRFRLLGNYRTPRIRVGTVLSCEARDCDMIVVGYSDARIPWPIGRRRGLSARSLIVFGDLIRAVCIESHQAIKYWFGVGGNSVSKWRKALGVAVTNPGTYRLRSDYTREPWAVKALKKAHSRACDPERRRKIAEAKRGKPRPPHVIRAMAKARTGKRMSDAFRAGATERGRKRFAAGFVLNGRPWTIEQDNMVRTLPAAEVAKLMGRTLRSVYDRRRRLGVPDGRLS